MRHSLPYRMLRKRPMKLSTTVILMVSAVLFSVRLDYAGEDYCQVWIEMR